MTKSIQDLREKRDALAVNARALLDENPGDKWNSDCDAKFNALRDEISDVDNEIKRNEEVLEVEAKAAKYNTEKVANIANSHGVSIDEATDFANQEKEVFNTYIRKGFNGLTAEQREFAATRAQKAREIYGAQSIGTDSEGGYLVPTDFGGRILEALKAYGGVRQAATVQSTSDGVPIEWPTADATSEVGEIVGENTAVTDEDTSFGTVNLGAYKYSSKGVAVPFELLQDARVDIEGYLIRVLSTRLARITNQHFTTGTGTGQPQGIVTASAVGKVGTTGQTTSVTYDDLVDLQHEVDLAYRQSGSTRFMFHDSTLAVLKKLKDADGRPLWLPGISSSEPDTILGEGYLVSNDMPVMAANARSIIYGDFSKYMIRDVMNVMLFRMTDSAYTRLGQVGFLAFSRHDGKLIAANDQAFKHYANSAT